jgi:hypothetical protein
LQENYLSQDAILRQLRNKKNMPSHHKTKPCGRRCNIYNGFLERDTISHERGQRKKKITII